jgi:hypothetical protein
MKDFQFSLHFAVSSSIWDRSMLMCHFFSTTDRRCSTFVDSSTSATSPCLHDDSSSWHSLRPLSAPRVERVGIWESREWRLGASKRTCVAYDRDNIRSGELSGSAVLFRVGRAFLCLRAHQASLRQNRKKLMLTTLQEHHHNCTLDIIYGVLCV